MFVSIAAGKASNGLGAVGVVANGTPTVEEMSTGARFRL